MRGADLAGLKPRYGYVFLERTSGGGIQKQITRCWCVGSLVRTLSSFGNLEALSQSLVQGLKGNVGHGGPDGDMFPVVSRRVNPVREQDDV